MSDIRNEVPMIRTFANGIQFTFPNYYTVLIKLGPGTQTNLLNKPEDDIASTFMGRFGGFMSANAEVEVYDPNSLNITSKFQDDARSLSYVDPMRLIDLMYIISNLS